jgi:peroxiredoxin
MSWWKQRKTLEAGSQAPDFELRTLSGASESLKGILARGPALLAFFKVSCPVCQFTFPFLERVWQGAGRGAVQFLAISQDDARATQEFNRQFGITFPTLLDEAGKGYPVSNAFAITTVPSLFLIEPDGSISSALSGFSKKAVAELGQRTGVAPFRTDEYVPEWQAG